MAAKPINLGFLQEAGCLDQQKQPIRSEEGHVNKHTGMVSFSWDAIPVDLAGIVR
jgi:hypothetical protein